MNVDLHTHTYPASDCSHISFRDYIAWCVEHGVEAVALTNHGDVSDNRKLEPALAAEGVLLVHITTQVAAAAAESAVRDGVVVVYVPHTTAGVTINENADPSVRADMKLALERLVPQSLPFTHLEGNADAHVKASLMGSSVTVPLTDGRLQLGTWQGVYFAEFDGPRRRRVLVSVLAAQ